MQKKTEQFSDMQRKNVDTGMKLAQMSIENSQRIVALQVEAARRLFEGGVENARALASVKSPQEAVALQTQYAQEAAQKMMEAARQIAELGNVSRSEFSQLVTEQLAGGSQDAMASFQSFFGAIPAQGFDVMEAMKQSMVATNAAIEQLASVSNAFGRAAAPAEKKKS